MLILSGLAPTLLNRRSRLVRGAGNLSWQPALCLSHSPYSSSSLCPKWPSCCYTLLSESCQPFPIQTRVNHYPYENNLNGSNLSNIPIICFSNIPFFREEYSILQTLIIQSNNNSTSTRFSTASINRGMCLVYSVVLAYL